MAQSNYRYDPFLDLSTAIDRAELIMVPATSPYTIQLAEVPRKDTPGTLSIKQVTNIGADGYEFGTIFSEVAAEPASGEFWPDYNTGADGDDNWNTGRIKFNSTDAGKIIYVSYKGTGTLAAVGGSGGNEWFHDYGDGSDGDLIVSQNIGLNAGTYKYRRLIINENTVVNANASPLIIFCSEIAVIRGMLTATAAANNGGAGSRGYGAAANNTGTNNAGPGGEGKGGGAGGAGSNGRTGTGAAGGASTQDTAYNYGNYSQLLTDLKGAGGGGAGGGFYGGENYQYISGNAGGNGGGELLLISPIIILESTGTIASNGGDGLPSGEPDPGNKLLAGGSGGGGGGVVGLFAGAMDIQGSITVNGGGVSYRGGSVGADGVSFTVEG